jgi:hypothetical protein
VLAKGKKRHHEDEDEDEDASDTEEFGCMLARLSKKPNRVTTSAPKPTRATASGKAVGGKSVALGGKAASGKCGVARGEHVGAQ